MINHSSIDKIASNCALNRKSPLKWAGGKKRIIKSIQEHLPYQNKVRLIEPFVGGGSVFLNINVEKYLLIDTNKDLIDLFNFIKTEPEKLIGTAKKMFNVSTNLPHYYYLIRDKFNASNRSIEKSAQFIYLNRHGYNGLCRYNSKGGFNVPFGRYKRPYFPEKEILYFHNRAQRAEFICADFATAFEHASKDDVIYCDPPYSPVGSTSNFTSYAKDGFSHHDQQRLVECAIEAKDKGVSTLISNHYLPETIELYKQADEITKLKVQRNISCKGNVRKKIEELMALYEAQ